MKQAKTQYDVGFNMSAEDTLDRIAKIHGGSALDGYYWTFPTQEAAEAFGRQVETITQQLLKYKVFKIEE